MEGNSVMSRYDTVGVFEEAKMHLQSIPRFCMELARKFYFSMTSLKENFRFHCCSVLHEVKNVPSKLIIIDLCLAWQLSPSIISVASC